MGETFMKHKACCMQWQSGTFIALASNAIETGFATSYALLPACAVTSGSRFLLHFITIEMLSGFRSPGSVC